MVETAAGSPGQQQQRPQHHLAVSTDAAQGEEAGGARQEPSELPHRAEQKTGFREDLNPETNSETNSETNH